MNSVIRLSARGSVVVRALSLAMVALLLFAFGATPALAQTFTTIADGNWSSPATWSGGSVPTTSGNFPSTYVINIRHTVTWNSSNNIVNDGEVRIEPIVGTTAQLNLPTGVNVENTGEWYIINGALIQFRFVGGGDSGTPQSGSFKNKGGLVEVLNSIVEIAQDWTNEKGDAGAVRTFTNSCLITGQNFSNADSFDTLIGSTVSIGWHGSGSFQYSDVEFEFQDVRIQLAGTSGNFELNKGLAFGDIDYITLKNHVTDTIGSGKILAASSLDTTPGLNLDAFCAATYESNGKFSGTQTSEPRPACPLTDVYFPCVPGTAEDPQLTLVKVVTNDNGGNAATNDFDLNLEGTDGVHDAGVDYQDSGSGVLPTVTDGVEYTVSETPLDGYTLDSIVCDDDDIGGTTNIGTTFTLDPGQNVTCTFTNNDIAPTLTLTKVVNDIAGGLELGPDDFGISVGGAPVVSGATNSYDANTPLAIDEVLPAGYSFTSLTGDPECPGALGGTVTLDEGDDVSCTITNTEIEQTEGPNIDLAKAVVSGPAFDTATNRWTVVYSVTATNLGDESGSYDLVDTLTPATGISVFVAELTSYDGGSENSQTGTILGDAATPEEFTSGDTLVDEEELGAGLSESWTVTVEFEVDLADIDSDAYACIEGDETEGSGFYNYVDGVGDEANLDNNDACTNLPEWDINLSKTVSSTTLVDADTFSVVYSIQAENTGAAFGLYDLIDTLDPGTGITLVSVELTAYVAGTENSQTGTLAGALPYTFTSGDTLVTNEALAAGLVESWSITAVFDVDWDNGQLEADCVVDNFGAGTGFYDFAEGNIDENTDDNHACSGPSDPVLDVTKDVTDLVENPDGTFSVTYTIVVSNAGQKPAFYSLDDTLLVDNSATLTAIDQALTYDAGSSNDLWVPAQSGTIETVTVGDLLGGTTTLLSGEALAGESDETWTIVLRFEIDGALLSEEGADCVLETSETGTGFLNRIEVVVNEETAAEDEGCDEIPPLDAEFTVYKSYDDDNTTAVSIALQCSAGTVTTSPRNAAPGAPAVFEVTGFYGDPDPTCTAVESGVPAGYSTDNTDCVSVALLGDGECTIVNTVNTGTFTVRKQYTDGSTDPVSVTATCTAPAEVTNNPQPASPSGSAIFDVTKVVPGVTTCTATEVVPPGYEGDISDCQDGDPIDGGCTIVNDPVGRATFRVTKDFTDDNPNEVEVRISCNTGLPLDQSQEIVEGDYVEFVVVEFDGGEMDCDVDEVVPEGYSPTYTAGTEPDGNAGNVGQDEDSCFYEDVVNGGFTCHIVNTPDPVDVVITKEWVFEGTSEDQGINTYYQLTLYCDAEIVDGSDWCPGAEATEVPAGDNGIWCRTFHGNGPDVFTAQVIPEYPESSCWVVESVFDDAVEVDNGCEWLTVSAGNGASCTIVNTVFFEGIPTLSQYGQLLLALLMLGMGFVAYRRFA